MANKKEIVVNFSVLSKDAIKSIQDMQAKVENLKKVQADLKRVGMENSETYIKNAAAIKAYTQAIRENEKELNNEIKENQAAGDSLNQMRATLSNLIAEYANLTKAERDSAQGKELLQKIDEQRTKVEELEHTMGDWHRQVGHYQEAVLGLTGPLGTAAKFFQNLSGGTMKVGTAFKNGVTAVKAFSKQLLRLLANPIVAIIAAIAVVVMKLVDAFKKNDDAMTSLKKAFAAFQPILDVINNAIQKLVGAIAKLVEGFGRLVTKVASWVSPDFGKAAEEAQQLVQREDDLEEAERKYTEAHAQRERDIAELREKATDAEEYSIEERRKALLEAQKLEKEDVLEKERLAREAYEIEKKKAEQAKDTSDETKNRLSELKAAYIGAQTELANFNRKITKELKGLAREEEAQEKERIAKAKEWAQKRKEMKERELEEERKLRDLRNSLLQDGYKRQMNTLVATYTDEITKLGEALKNGGLTKKAAEAIKEQIKTLNQALQIEVDKLKKNFREMASDANFGFLVEQNSRYIAMMENGYKKTVAQINLEKDQRTRAHNARIAELDELMKAYEGVDEVSYQMAKRQYDQENELFKLDKEIYRRREEEAKRQVAEQIKEATGLYEFEKKMLELGVEDEANAEVAKTQFLQQQAEERTKIRQEELEEAKRAYEQDPTEDNRLKLAQAELRAVEAEKEFREAIRATDDALTKQQVKAISDFNKIAGAIGNMVGGFEEMFNAMAEGNAKYQKYATAMAISQIYISMATSIAQAVQAAVQAGGFTGPAAPVTIPVFIAELIGIVASTIGSTIATINKAKQNQAAPPKFAEGGLVGNKTTAREDDSVNAKLSYGEYVIKSKKVREYGVDFFDRINFGKHQTNLFGRSYAEGGYVAPSTDVDALKVAVSEALLDMPSPVVSVKEIINTENRIKAKEAL